MSVGSPVVRRGSTALHLPGPAAPERRAELALDLDQARVFYRQNADETLMRMRRPTSPTSNIAVVIVLHCETNARLRAEAAEAVDAARRAAEAHRALNMVIAAYDPQSRS